MVVGTQPLEDAVPEGDQRSKGPLIKLLVHPGSQESGWQKLVETAQELGGAKTGAEQLRSLGFALHSLVQQARSSRPELKQNHAFSAAALDAQTGATYGPWIPTVGAQAFFGGLGGGRRGIADTFGEQEAYAVGLSWRIGPGGLFDFTRSRAAEARVKISQLNEERLSDDVAREVVEAFTRWQSSTGQIQD